jgi:hypothetical protein
MHAKEKDSDVMNVSFTLIVNPKASLCPNKHDTIKNGGIAPHILNLGSRLSGQLYVPTALLVREWSTGIHQSGGCKGPRAGLDFLTKEKSLGRSGI